MMKESCQHVCPLGRYGNVEGVVGRPSENSPGKIISDTACPLLCQNGTHGIATGPTIWPTEERFACAKCSIGKFQDAVGQVECKPCPEGKYQNKKGGIQCTQCTRDSLRNIACNGHGTCDKKTGDCTCNPGTGWDNWPPENACYKCNSNLWNYVGGTCNTCLSTVNTYRHNGVIQCKPQCNTDTKTFNPDTGTCELNKWQKALNLI